jgi:uncharacterized protein YegP (UPF0339 family)
MALGHLASKKEDINMATKRKKLPKSSMPRQKNPQKGSVEVYKSIESGSGKGLWRWRLKGSNGKVLANAAEAYMTRAGVMNAAARMIDYDLSELKIVEIEEVVLEPVMPQPAQTPKSALQPFVRIMSPNGGRVNGTFEVTVEAHDLTPGNQPDASGISQVDLYVDGKISGSAQTSTDARYRFQVNSFLYLNGEHELMARAVDRDGNKGDSQTVRVTVRN